MKIHSVVRCSVLQLCIGTLAALPAFAQAGKAKLSSETVLGVRCSDIFKLGIDKQENLRATAIRVGCGLEAAGAAGEEADGFDAVDDLINVNTITGLETYPHVTHSESMVWSTPDGLTVVVNYNDSNTAPSNYSGVSVSVDGGKFFERILPAPFATGHGTNFGDPIVVYNNALGKWFAGDLATGCGGQGIGLWTSDDGMAWTVGACAHNSGQDDRESMWVDNNPASPFYGRMYVSWNDFAAGQEIFVTHSDNGTTWSAPVRVSTGFIRNIQLTGSPGDDGTVFIGGMNEGGGGMNNRINLIYRSLDGGAHWTTAIQQGPPFAPPGQTLGLCGSYFAAIPPIWRHMGWGQPAVGPNSVVHYAYAGRGANPDDLGDIFYTRSADNGTTWSAPIILNSDAAKGGNKAQWMPSVSVTPEGNVVVSWYDRRNTTDGTNYERWGIQSPDNGLSFGQDERYSDTLIQQPEQPDSGVQACYAGDYDYSSAVSSKSWVTWTDGRNQVSGHYQQDVYFASVEQGPPTGGILEGTVTDGASDAPIAGARVHAVGPVDRTTSTNGAGFYRFRLPEGSYDMSVTAFAYLPGSASGVPVVEGQTTTQDFALTLGPAHSVSGTVSNLATGQPIAGAQVKVLNTPIPPGVTDESGAYLIPSVPEGTFDLQATAPPFLPSAQSITVDQDVVVNFALAQDVSFEAAVNFDIGRGPFSVAVGDFNGDGLPDLAVANKFSNNPSNNLSVLLGNGDGSFQAPRNFGAGDSPSSVAVGDFNGDGVLDLAVANDIVAGTVSVLLGNGDGSFQAPQNFAAGSGAFSVAVGDFNGDGLPDLAVANNGQGQGTTVSVLLGNGDGSFQAPRNFRAGSVPFSVAVGDFNGDGLPDLAVANDVSNNVSVLLGNGDGSFQAARNFAAGSRPHFVAVGDFNGDSLPDLAVANYQSFTVSVLLGNGDGSFQAARNFGAGRGPFGVAVGDFNGDGLPDLAVANDSASNVSVLLGNGDGTFLAPRSFGVGGTRPFSVAVGDFNGDGLPDLAVANVDSDNVSVLINNTGL